MKALKRKLKNWNGKLFGRGAGFWIPFISFGLWFRWLAFDALYFENGNVLAWIILGIGLVVSYWLSRLLEPLLSNLFSAAIGVKDMKKAGEISGEVKAFESKRTGLAVGAVVFYIVAVTAVAALLFTLGPVAAFIGGAVAALIYKLVISDSRKALEQQVKDNSLRSLLEEQFQIEKYSETTSLTAGAVAGLGVFSDRVDEVQCNDLIQAKRNGCAFTRVDLRILRVEVVAVDNNVGPDSEQRTEREIFNGSLLSMDHKLALPDTRVMICYDGTPGLAVSGMEKLDVELYSFNEKLDVFTDNPEGALVLLTPQLVEALDKLAEACACGVIIVFNGSKFLLFTSDGGDQFETNAKNQSVAAGIVKTKKQVEKLAAIVDTLTFLNK